MVMKGGSTGKREVDNLLNAIFARLEEGGNVTITRTSTGISIAATGETGVATLNAMAGALSIVEGTGISVTVDEEAKTITIAFDGTIPAAGDTVEEETTFGLSADAGAASTFSRSDHTHGTPADPGGGEFVGMSAYLLGADCEESSYASIGVDMEDYDEGDFIDSGTITIPENGYYEIDAVGTVGSTGSDLNCYLELLADSSMIATSAHTVTTSAIAAYDTWNLHRSMYLASGTVITLKITNNHASQNAQTAYGHIAIKQLKAVTIP